MGYKGQQISFANIHHLLTSFPTIQTHHSCSNFLLRQYKFNLGFVLLAITAVSMAASIPDTNSTTLQKRGSTSPGCAEPDDHGNRYRWASCTRDFGSKSGTPNTDEYIEGGYWCWLSWQGNQRTTCNDGNAGPLQHDVLCLGHSLYAKNTVQYRHRGCNQ